MIKKEGRYKSKKTISLLHDQRFHWSLEGIPHIEEKMHANNKKKNRKIKKTNSRLKFPSPGGFKFWY